MQISSIVSSLKLSVLLNSSCVRLSLITAPCDTDASANRVWPLCDPVWRHSLTVTQNLCFVNGTNVVCPFLGVMQPGSSLLWPFFVYQLDKHLYVTSRLCRQFRDSMDAVLEWARKSIPNRVILFLFFKKKNAQLTITDQLASWIMMLVSSPLASLTISELNYEVALMSRRTRVKGAWSNWRISTRVISSRPELKMF